MNTQTYSAAKADNGSQHVVGKDDAIVIGQLHDQIDYLHDVIQDLNDRLYYLDYRTIFDGGDVSSFEGNNGRATGITLIIDGPRVHTVAKDVREDDVSVSDYMDNPTQVDVQTHTNLSDRFWYVDDHADRRPNSDPRCQPWTNYPDDNPEIYRGGHDSDNAPDDTPPTSGGNVEAI